MEILQEVFKILQEISRGAKQLPRAHVAFKFGTVQLIPTIGSLSHLVDPSSLLGNKCVKTSKNFPFQYLLLQYESACPSFNVHKGSESAGLFANNVFKYGLVPVDAGIGEYSDMLQT